MEILNYEKIIEENKQIAVVNKFAELCSKTGVEFSTISLPTEITTTTTEAIKRREECSAHTVLTMRVTRDCYFGTIYCGYCTKCGAWCSYDTEDMTYTADGKIIPVEIDFQHAKVDFDNTKGIKSFNYNGHSGYTIDPRVYRNLFDAIAKENAVDNDVAVKTHK